MKIVTAAEMREIDRRTTEEFGIPSLTLMENAGSAVAEFCLREYPDANTIGVICGKGNNGGDGFVAARKLHEAGKTVRVLLLADPAEVKGDAAEMLKRMPELGQRMVAIMADRIRETTKMDSQRDKLMALGKLSAGLAHELNNPAAAAQRATASLRETLETVRESSIKLSRHVLSAEQREMIIQFERKAGQFTAAAPADPLEPRLSHARRADGLSHRAGDPAADRRGSAARGAAPRRRLADGRGRPGRPAPVADGAAGPATERTEEPPARDAPSAVIAGAGADAAARGGARRRSQ